MRVFYTIVLKSGLQADMAACSGRLYQMSKIQGARRSQHDGPTVSEVWAKREMVRDSAASSEHPVGHTKQGQI